jgi:hypothetical protein
MRKYGCLVVEGPHDVEFTYRLLSPFDLNRIQLIEHLDSRLTPLIPSEFPVKGDLQKRVSVPLFLQNDTHCIAIHSAIGDSQLVNTLYDDIELFDENPFSGVGILLDSDKQISPDKRYFCIKTELQKKALVFPDIPGQVSTTSPKMGMYVLPDNQNIGTLEDLLLKSAATMYPGLLPVAKNYASQAKVCGLQNKELQDFNKPAGENKAVIGAMANIFRPGKSVQVSIQDNDWLRGQALLIPQIKAVQDFLKALFDIP